MKRSSGPSTRAPSALLLVSSLLLLFGSGCVTRGTYDTVVTERDGLAADKTRLEERARLLEASTASLDNERARLIDELEDLRQTQEQLDRDVRRLSKAEAELSESLAAREEELASRSEELSQLRGTYQDLVSDLEAELASGEIEIRQLREGLQLDVSQDVLFASGSATVNSGGRRVLGLVAERVRDVPYVIVVQGHSDNVPIHSERYPTNWELAAARASHVVRLLAKGGVPPERLSAVSFGEYKPRDSNETNEGRARNRRIEITLKPLADAPVAASLEEAAAAPATPAAPAP